MKKKDTESRVNIFLTLQTKSEHSFLLYFNTLKQKIVKKS